MYALWIFSCAVLLRGSPTIAEDTFRRSSSSSSEVEVELLRRSRAHNDGLVDGGGGGGGCEILDALTYTQADAPTNPNDILSIVSSHINNHVKGVVGVDITYSGDNVHRVVGEATVAADVTVLVGAGTTRTTCVKIPFTITDTDECILPNDHPMVHTCHETAECVNNQGGFECRCLSALGAFGEEGCGSPDGPAKGWAARREGRCGNANSTEWCCREQCELEDDRVVCIANCKADFRCQEDPCPGRCDKNADCLHEPKSGPWYECACHEGYVGDGYTCERPPPPPPVDFCANNNCPRNCRCEADVENEGYLCPPERGFIATEDASYWTPQNPDDGEHVRLDAHVCVDSRSVFLDIIGETVVSLRQCDTYEERGVTVDDTNREGFARHVKIDYSAPLSAGPLFKLGEYTVRYSVETPWLTDTPSVTKTRTVVVEDVDECSYDGDVDACRHVCHKDAKCTNTRGSHACECLPGFGGDGVVTGTGCVDVTMPVVECRGRGCTPARYHAAGSLWIKSVDGGRFGKSHELAVYDERKVEEYFQGEGDFCAAEDRPCFVAFDHTWHGTVDLTANVTIGALEKHPTKENAWRIAHDVEDAAGNGAITVYREIQVEIQVDIDAGASLLETAVSALCAVIFGLAWWQGRFRALVSTIQYALCPYSLLARRRDFEVGMNTYLCLTGVLGEKERARRVAVKWAAMVDEFSGDDDDSDDGDDDDE